MAKRKNSKHKPTASSALTAPEKQKKQLWLILAVIMAAVIFVYFPSLDNEFTNWDDDVYVKENPFIRDITGENIQQLFNPSTEVSLNYHPITILSLAFNYQISKLEPGSYFFLNIFLHLLNTVLIFFLIYILLNRNWIPAAFAALWFGIHPMHVESVSWISERKDVLYTLFYLGAMISYIFYLKKNKSSFIALAFILFILSCLSKAMAVTLPVALLLLDYLMKRKWNAKVILEKIPFFIISILIGLNAVAIQSQGAISEFETFTLFERLMFASYGLMMYVAKFFVPLKLSAVYPYPSYESGAALPIIYYLAPVISLVILITPVIWAYFYHKKYLRPIIFGFGFFLLNVALVLQFVSVGIAIMADRYSYLSYFGLLFLLGYILYEIINIRPALKTTVLAVVAIYSLIFIYAAHERTKVWQNTVTLWTDVIQKYPEKVETAYKNRGNYYGQNNMSEKAMADYQVLMKMQSTDPKVYSNLGNVYGIQQDFQNALQAYNKSLELDKDNFDAYLNRGITYAMMGQPQLALQDFNKAAAIEPNNQKLLTNRAYVLIDAGQPQQAIQDFNNLLMQNPNNPELYFNRARAYYSINNFQQAAQDFSQAIRLKQQYPEAYFNLSVVYYKLGDYRQALQYAQQAKMQGYPVQETYLAELEQKL